jgi:peptidoglycan/xylan/chitin deacetylase (PgdA/CDA1 family)
VFQAAPPRATLRWPQLYRGGARQIAARHPIANNTFDHRDVLGLTLPEVRNEVLSASSEIDSATGRPPNPADNSTLDADPGIISAIRARGYRFVTLNQYL